MHIVFVARIQMEMKHLFENDFTNIYILKNHICVKTSKKHITDYQCNLHTILYEKTKTKQKMEIKN